MTQQLGPQRILHSRVPLKECFLQLQPPICQRCAASANTCGMGVSSVNNSHVENQTCVAFRQQCRGWLGFAVGKHIFTALTQHRDRCQIILKTRFHRKQLRSFQHSSLAPSAASLTLTSVVTHAGPIQLFSGPQTDLITNWLLLLLLSRFEYLLS